MAVLSSLFGIYIKVFFYVGFNVGKRDRLSLHFHTVGKTFCFGQGDPQYDINDEADAEKDRKDDEEQSDGNNIDSKKGSYSS